MTERFGFFGDHRTQLGESPVWDARTRRLWWIDAMSVFATEAFIHGAEADGTPCGTLKGRRAIGSIGLAEHGFVVAMTDGIYHLDLAGNECRLAAVDTHGDTMRFNDGKMDRAGQYITGQIEYVETHEPECATWRLNRDGGLARLAEGIRMQNATCYSPAGDILYFTDSLTPTIRIHEYDPNSATLGARIGTIDCEPLGSVPDGATVDSAGNLWVALVYAQALVCFSPEGRLLRRIELPVPYPSCPAFGGDDMATLFVTTIASSGRRIKSDHSDAGRLLTIDGLGATGIPEAPWAGSPPPP